MTGTKVKLSQVEKRLRLQSGRAAARNLAIIGGMVACLISLAILALRMHKAAESEVVDLYEGLQKESAELTASRIKLFLHECDQSLNDLARLEVLGDAPESGAVGRLDLEFFEGLDGNVCGPLSVFNASGDVVFSEAGVRSWEGRRKAYESWAQDPGRRGSGRGLLGPFKIEDAKNRVGDRRVVPVLFELVAPINVSDVQKGQYVFAGGITYQIELERLIHHAETLEREEGAETYTWIMSSSGVLLWQAEHPEMVFNSIKDRDGSDEACSTCHTSFDYLDQILEEQRGSTTYKVSGFPAKLVAYAPMQFQNETWVIATNCSLNSITSFQRESWRQTLLLMFAAVLVLSGGLMLAYRNYRELLQAEAEAKHWRAKEQLERKLNEAEVRFRTMIQSAHDLIWTIDGEGRFGFVNPRVKEVTGYDTAALQRQPVAKLIPESDVPKVESAIKEAGRGEVPIYEVRITSRDGEEHFLSVNTVALRDESGFKGTVSFGRDITFQKQTMAALRRKSEREELVNRVLRIGLATLSLDLKLERCLEVILGISWLPLSPRGGILLLNKDEDELVMVAQLNLAEEVTRRCSRVPVGHCLCGIAARDRRFVFSTYVDEDHAIGHGPDDDHGHCVAPIVSGDQLLGVLVLYVPVGYVWSQDEKSFLVLLANTLAWVVERAHAEDALRKSEERYMLASEGARDGLWDWDLQRQEIFYSERWKSMVGLPHDGIGTNPDEWFALVHRDDLNRVKKQLEDHLSQKEAHFECEYRLRHSDGSYRWVSARGLAFRDSSGVPLRIAGSQTDISERKTIEEQLRHNAFHDMLTNLANRALLLDRLGRCLERQKRRSSYLFAVMLIDLDQFKVVNDSLGHQAGDHLLSEIAKRLLQIVRDGDTVARLGGDEFAIILVDISSIMDATRVAMRLHRVLREPHRIGGHEVFTTASVGIAMASANYESAEELLRDADTAMYRAKASGRGTHQVFNIKMHREALEAMTWENDLRRAVNRSEFELHYQPIFSCDGEVAVVEALVRWRHPELGLLAPGKFINLAEDTDLIVELGEWVLKTACAQISRWRAQGHPRMRVAVNVSARQFVRRDMEAVIASTLQETGCSPDALEIELTESCIMGTGESNISTLRAIASTGVSVALDDFGTGYSSLFVLKRLPIQVIKIDRAFVMNIVKSERDKAITRAVISMAHSLGLTVTGEGVENSEQVRILKGLRCDRLQGYLFSSPVSRDDFEENSSHGWPNVGILGG